MTALAVVRPLYIAEVFGLLRTQLVPEPNERVEWAQLYQRLVEIWMSEPDCRIVQRGLSYAFDNSPSPAPPSEPEFGVTMAHICRRAGIRVHVDGDRVYCLDVRLTTPPDSAGGTDAE